MTRSPLQPVIAAIGEVLLGKERAVKLALACLLARGHLLIEDLPGVGKSTLAEALARSFGLGFKRVSFTSDLLPADLTGINVFESASASFRFHPGPLFSEVLLADEINRASPRTQSALLEAMAAGRVSVDGTSHPLPDPFLVIATQNGLDQGGTAPLPESQLDRFLMRLSLGFPERAAEQALLTGAGGHPDTIATGLGPADLRALQQQAAGQHCSAALVDYVLDLLARSRSSGMGGMPLSPRAGLALVAAARAWSLLEGRDHVLPDDVQAVLAPVCEHRLDGGQPRHEPGELSRELGRGVDGLR
ncbi:MoxR family ATPase [Synechococcus sp. Cruz-9H2]|uniref:AAA family ATPase n=1 Tax=unclassified Synechococcus TaxID=2626047 RepID=UPI0020CB9181|nr:MULTISPECIES: MoxR family ATPase [unclassified Synechococcus]MCP9820344.1 MoxR family ATPase [Synechococcus sp. Cruz-9H2]MCP9844652.1 MoxR family ATPase [Synechococcus sp. Edmonson 11F2]MCP9856774.1 MoxR family ATPase [Synechococcus sp. Cruz-9C9]MCP9864016.1 MoxR family ATPase [Synechococcus sp. Cruz-7E5]MCP9871211.1 MoxR family ATPase [Synechococcus sp. Cruz-7B9]